MFRWCLRLIAAIRWLRVGRSGWSGFSWMGTLIFGGTPKITRETRVLHHKLDYRLKDEWHDGLHLFFVVRIAVGEMLQHQLFFLIELDPESEGHQGQGEPAANAGDLDRGAEAHQ